MALHLQLSSFPTTNFITRFPPSTIRLASVGYLSCRRNRSLAAGQLRSCRMASEATENTNQLARRSATYREHAWDYDSILSLKSIYVMFWMPTVLCLDEIQLFVDADERFVVTILTRNELERGGDSPKSIQWYMHETGASKEEACEHMRHLIIESWKTINNERSSNPVFSEAFMEVAVNSARTTQFLFQQVSEYESARRKTKDAIASMLIQPISFQDHDRKSSGTDKMAHVVI